MREKTVAIIGQGYVGLPLAIAAVGAGYEVIGIDSQELRVKAIASGNNLKTGLALK